MMDDARRHRFDVLLVWSCDRLARSTKHLLQTIDELNGMGIQLKGPLEGLIDFPSYRDGELIELCWKLGEERVEHWHRIGEGYGGRKKL